VVDPHAENYFHASPYTYVENNPISRIDPDGRDWYEDKEGNLHWHTDLTKDNYESFFEEHNIEGNYLGQAVVVMDGSGGENLGSSGTLTGEDALSAKVTIYGPGGPDDIQTYDGLTVSSDPNLFTPIASGDYEGYHQQMASSIYGQGSLTYRIRQLDGNHTLPTEGGALNIDPHSRNYGTPYKTEIYLHRTNNDGFAGARDQRRAVTKGCPVICGTQWPRVEQQLGKISSFRLRIIR